jgi:hypothetical protein
MEQMAEAAARPRMAAVRYGPDREQPGVDDPGRPEPVEQHAPALGPEHVLHRHGDLPTFRQGGERNFGLHDRVIVQGDRDALDAFEGNIDWRVADIEYPAAQVCSQKRMASAQVASKPRQAMAWDMNRSIIG